jgi:L-ascorbate metabolism protein UlaG (beta-lactamase superfamily)
MLPIGGGAVGNTMDEREALKAVGVLRPGLVISCHSNLPALFWRRFCPADDREYQRAVEREGSQCRILKRGESIQMEESIHAIPST